MNHLVFLDTQAGELEKILSGVKSMVVHEYEPSQSPANKLRPGDSLYFLRNNDECSIRVKAIVTRILLFNNSLEVELSHHLKEMQFKLQLTENQYNHWAAKKQALFVEFDCAHKIPVIHVAFNKIKDRSGWIAIEDISLIT